MADDEAVATFTAFTSASPEQAQQYLALTDDNVEQAVELFYSNPDLGASAAVAPSATTQPSSNRDHALTADDDGDAAEEMGPVLDDDVRVIGSRNNVGGVRQGHSVEEDEAMARRLQEEMYGGGGGGARSADDVDAEGYRAPMPRTTETLVGPGSDPDPYDRPDTMHSAILAQLAARHYGGYGGVGGGSRGAARAGIFNQRQQPSIWANDDPNDPELHRQTLSRATGGASDVSSKSNLLAELFKPPFDLIAKLPWSEARDQGKEKQKWMLVNVQDPSIFDCQVLNRDIWKNSQIRETIQEHFIFLQYNKDDPRGREYIQYYFANMRDSEDAYPHVAILDPRTGEQVKTWSGSPAPNASDFLMDLHEFLDRYSLSMERKNPVQGKKKEVKKRVEQMSEEEMLEMAMQNSLANASGTTPRDGDRDPDSLTRPEVNGKGKQRMTEPKAMDPSHLAPVPQQNGRQHSATGTAAAAKSDTPFSRISTTSPHEEPTSTGPDTTRIQFRYSGGRVVRRFNLSDPVRRIYEWLKAEPLTGTEGRDFELISMGKNLIGSLEVPIGDAGLKQGTVMVEFVGGNDEDEL